MLEGLCGNRTIQKILLFLFVNNKCYGTQLHHQLKTPLTPIQKALLRLEKGGVLFSYCEGKTRLYQFNPGYPLLPELEQLLKKAYTLLPNHERKAYYVPKESPSAMLLNPIMQSKVILSFWRKLSNVRQLTFNAKTKSKSGWQGRGKGEVVVTKENENTLIFHEKGTWQGDQNEVVFSNVFRWTLDKENGTISLEHLRRGVDHPVFLFDLAPTGPQALASVDSHLCEGDTYFGQIFLDQYGVRLNWRVIGPKKNEEIDYFYA